MKTRVLVVDDSALMRAVLCEIINASGDLEVVGTAADPLAARQAIKSLAPDVLTLDVNMPRMDGLEFLDRLMRLRPMPVVMISSETERDSETTVRALQLGAVDVIGKPRLDPGGGLRDAAHEIWDKLRAASQTRVRPPERAAAAPDEARLDERTLREKLVLIGASTGGTEALRAVLTQLPERMPGVLIVQHMPEMFTTSFARRLDGLARLRVKEAEHQERVQPGTVYLAPGHSHLTVRRHGGSYLCELARSEPVNRHRPSVDVLFHSAAEQVGANALGVMLTGMGRDGAVGMLAMRKAGAWNIAQDQHSSVVWGMPREAAAIGATHEVAPLAEIPARLLQRLKSS